MALVGLLLGALIGTLILSRLVWLLARFWKPDTIGKAVAVNGLSGLLVICLAAYGYADGAGPKFFEAALIYGPCQLLVLLTDILRTKH